MNGKRGWGRAALALVLAAGFAAAWGLAAVWLVGVWESVAADPNVYEYVQFRSDGEPVITRLVNGTAREQRKLNGTPLPLGGPILGADIYYLQPAHLPARLRPGRDGLPWEDRVRSFLDRMGGVYWYLVSDGRREGGAYFVGYDSQTNVCVGYVGTGGYRPGLPPEGERIPFTGGVPDSDRVSATGYGGVRGSFPSQGVQPGVVPGYPSAGDVYVLARDGVVYHADLNARKLEALPIEGARSLGMASEYVKDRGGLSRPAVRTADAVLLLDDRGREVRRHAIPEALRELGFGFVPMPEGRAVMYQQTLPADNPPGERLHRFHEVAADGATRVTEARLLAGSHQVPNVLAGLAMPSPGVMAVLFAIGTAESANDEPGNSLADSAGRGWREYWPVFAVTVVVAVVFAVLCYRRQARYQATGSALWGWPLFVLLLGLPGWVGYRFGRSWPALERCPTCGREVPRDRGECAACAAEFPRPALRGTEVFA